MGIRPHPLSHRQEQGTWNKEQGPPLAPCSWAALSPVEGFLVPGGPGLLVPGGPGGLVPGSWFLVPCSLPTLRLAALGDLVAVGAGVEVWAMAAVRRYG